MKREARICVRRLFFRCRTPIAVYSRVVAHDRFRRQMDDCSLTKQMIIITFFTRQDGTVDSWSALQIPREQSRRLAQKSVMMQKKLPLPLLLLLSMIVPSSSSSSSPPLAFRLMSEVMTSCIQLYFRPDLRLTMILLQSHACSTRRRRDLPSRPFVST